MNGLHSCKPGNEPQIGQVKTFVVEQRVSASGKDWTKIKSATSADGGSPYRVVKADKTDYVDKYGNLSFNLDIEPAQNGAPQAHAAPQARNTAWVSDDRSNRIERQHSQEMAIRWFLGSGKIEDLADLKKLRAMIDYFQKDIGRMPQEREPEPQVEDDGPPPDEEESF